MVMPGALMYRGQCPLVYYKEEHGDDIFLAGSLHKVPALVHTVALALCFLFQQNKMKTLLSLDLMCLMICNFTA